MGQKVLEVRWLKVKELTQVGRVKLRIDAYEGPFGGMVAPQDSAHGRLILSVWGGGAGAVLLLLFHKNGEPLWRLQSSSVDVQLAAALRDAGQGHGRPTSMSIITVRRNST